MLEIWKWKLANDNYYVIWNLHLIFHIWSLKSQNYLKCIIFLLFYFLTVMFICIWIDMLKFFDKKYDSLSDKLTLFESIFFWAEQGLSHWGFQPWWKCWVTQLFFLFLSNDLIHSDIFLQVQIFDCPDNTPFYLFIWHHAHFHEALLESIQSFTLTTSLGWDHKVPLYSHVYG